MATLVSKRGPALSGTVVVPGDKSISHRALILAAMATGKSRISGLSGGLDVQNTLQALKALGVACEQSGDVWHIRGAGKGGFKAPTAALWFGNSATGVRLMMGALAGLNISAELDGDESLKSRPMDRILTPLGDMGVKFSPIGKTKLTLKITGSDKLTPLTYRLPVASAQVKSALLLAGLNIKGKTTVIENCPTRDHTETMLPLFGVTVNQLNLPEGGIATTVNGGQPLTATDVSVPGDFSAAAFFIAAALIVPDSRLDIKNIGLNPLRSGFLDVLQKAGADISIRNTKTISGERIGDVLVKYSELSAITTQPTDAPGLIDEFPALFVLAAVANGTSRFRGLSELRVKESDRLFHMAQGLTAAGVPVNETKDSLTITGCSGNIPGGAVINAPYDHRIAMAFAILGLVAKNPITIKGSKSISTSFSGFAKVMSGVGANIKETSE